MNPGGLWLLCFSYKPLAVMCRAGKAMGDKRAIVAEKGFNRPFKRVIIAKSGLL
jgi:hypothetical protein